MFSAATKTGSQPSAAANYIEDVFSTYLYTGNSSTQTITNSIDLAGEGGMVWLKNRNSSQLHWLFDTIRGKDSPLSSTNTDSVATNVSNYFGGSNLCVFNSNGFTVNGAQSQLGATGNTYASWTFRKQPKFFDVVTYTGTGSAQNINHSLGSVPGMIIIKSTTNTRGWAVYHKDIGNTSAMYLNTTQAAFASDPVYWNNTSPTSTQFTVNYWTANNATGETYVAYLFAHNAGGFGTAGTDNVISCGSVTTPATSGYTTVNLGYEPQYVLLKQTNGAGGSWFVFDVMRGMSQTQGLALRPNLSNAEFDFGAPTPVIPTATGFNISSDQFYNGTYIYMAIRRPMKVPTDATTVFSPVKATATTPGFNAGFPVDMGILKNYPSGGFNELCSRLQGATYLTPTDTSAEGTDSGAKFDYQNGWYSSLPANTYIGWNFARRPGFFDQVCYTGTGSLTGVTHNLGVTPELKIIKSRSASLDWIVGGSIIGTNSNRLFLDLTDAITSYTWNGGTDSATQFSVRNGNSYTDASGTTYVAYLFATCPGVSKVGSYTGNGSTQAISCGFTGGARFVMIKRTDNTGDWYVYDTARGMTTLTDPYLLLNSTAAETVTLGSVTTTTGGFTVNASILAAINTSGASYIFLAIA